MWKKTEWRIDQSVLKRHILSFLTVAIFGCTVIGLTLFSFSTNELNKVAAEEMARRVRDVAEDLDRQIATMQSISYKISFKAQYKLSYIEKHKYREFELLDDLQKYQDYVPMANQLFLLYEGVDNVYIAPEKVTSLFTVYARSELGCVNQQAANELRTKIQSVESRELIRCNNGNLLYCSIVHHYDAAGRRVWLCYLVNRKDLEERILLIGGEIFGSIRLKWNDAVLYGSDSHEKVQISYGGKNGLLVELIGDKQLPYSRIQTFTKLFWSIIVSVLLTTCLIAWMAAKRNLGPIKELVNEFADQQEKLESEFNALQGLLKKTIENNRITQERLNDNLIWLNKQRRKNDEQMLLLALTGNISAPIQEVCEEETFFADEKRYAVICVAVEGSYDMNRLFDQINELSDRNAQICCVHLPFEALIAIGVSCADQSDYKSSIDLISDLFSACELTVRMGIGSLVDEPSCMPDSLAEALINLNAQSDKQSVRLDEWYDETLINRLLGYIKDGQKEEARNMLGTIFAQIENASPTILIRSCAYSNVINAIIRTALQSGIDLSASQMSIVLLYNHPPKLKELISTLLDEVCSFYESKKNERWAPQKEKLFDYIQENFCKYDLCLSELENVTGLSVRQIEQYVRDEMNKTFKEYLTELRMEEAKKLLERGMSVNDTSNAVCYMSVSFFIKTFKKSVGMTPAEYRRSIT